MNEERIKTVVLLLATVAFATAAILPCVGNNGLLPKAVVVDSCDSSEERCEFVRGKSFKADVTFRARKIMKI